MSGDDPHLPRQVLIDAYGDGGFRFGGLSHRGSILCLPHGTWRWAPQTPLAIDEAALAPVLERAAVDMILIGTGRDLHPLPGDLRARLRAVAAVDVMATGAAVRTYNILLGEGRRIAAGLIAVP